MPPRYEPRPRAENIDLPSLEGLVRRFETQPPLRGLQDGLDPALPDGLFDPSFFADLENIRVGAGTIETRFGMSLWRSIGAVGSVNFLGSVYTKAGGIYRLALQGSTLYDWEEGVDAAFAAVSGGTGIALVRLRGLQMGDKFYFTDRTNAVKRYNPVPSGASTVTSVALPTAPTAAPLVRPRYWGILEPWLGTVGSTPTGWSNSNGARFNITVVDPASEPDYLWPGSEYATAKVRAENTNAAGEYCTKTIATGGVLARSASIAFWVRYPHNRSRLTLQVGLNAPDDLPFAIRPPRADDWHVYSAPIGLLNALNYLRFKCTNAPADFVPFNVYFSPLFLPGKLQGHYQYRVAYYDGTSESEMSPASDPVDLSTILVNYTPETAQGFNKACAVVWAAGAGGTNRVYLYRSGGVPSLTTNSRGRPIWIRVASVLDFSTTLAAGITDGDTTCTLTSVTNLSTEFTAQEALTPKGEVWLVFGKGGLSEEHRRITALNAGTGVVTVDEPFKYAHSNGSAVQTCHVDNKANEELDPTQAVDVERDDPPAGVHWIARAGERLILFRWPNYPAGVAFSNRATPERPLDYEVFPDGVDPYTRQSLLQGWRSNVAGGQGGAEIMWGGVFNEEITVLTKTDLHRIYARSQLDWGPDPIPVVLENLGCINGDTFAVVNGIAVWVTDGPRVVAWDGQSAPRIISDLRINQRLRSAPTGHWDKWFACAHAKRDGNYYCLFYVPSGGTTVTDILQFNMDSQVWEPVVYYDSLGAKLTWSYAHVPRGGTDTRLLYATHPTSGSIFLLDDASVSTDNSVAIKIRATTKRFDMGGVNQLRRLMLHLAALTSDTVTLRAMVGGSEYGDVTHDYSLNLAGTGDLEKRLRFHYDMRGRWAQFRLSGDVSNRPAFRALEWWSYFIREYGLPDG